MRGVIGLPGALTEWSYSGTLSAKTERATSFSRTLGGKRKGFVSRRGRREWEVSFDLIGSTDVAGLEAIAESATQQVVWYPADAIAGNLLSPQAVSFSDTTSDYTDLGFVALPNGAVAHAVVPNPGAGIIVGNSHGNSEYVLTPDSGPMSFGTWAYGGGRVSGLWRDRDGLSIGSFAGTRQSFSGWQWVAQSFIPPAGAMYASLTLSEGERYAAPSASWDATAKDRPGRGCPKALVHGLSTGLTVIRNDDAYGSLSVTITEVG